MFSKNSDQLELDLLSKDECLSLIKDQVSYLNEGQLKEIIEKVEFIPNKIKMLGAKIKKMKHWNYQALLEEIEKDTIAFYETFKIEHILHFLLLLCSYRGDRFIVIIDLQ